MGIAGNNALQGRANTLCRNKNTLLAYLSSHRIRGIFYPWRTNANVRGRAGRLIGGGFSSFRERVFRGSWSGDEWLHLGRSHATAGIAVQPRAYDTAGPAEKFREPGTRGRGRRRRGPADLEPAGCRR